MDQTARQACMVKGARGDERKAQTQFNLSQHDREACTHGFEPDD